MLPRNGFFQNIQCPYNKANLCHRPYCHFKHAPTGPSEDKKIVVSSYLYNKDVDSRNLESISYSSSFDDNSGYIPTPVNKCKPTGILKANYPYSEKTSYPIPEYNPTPISKLRELNIPTGQDYSNHLEYTGSARKKKNIEEYDPTEIKYVPKKSVSFADETEGKLLTSESVFSSDDDLDDPNNAPKFSDDEDENYENNSKTLLLPPPVKSTISSVKKSESEESDVEDKKVNEFSLVDKILIETKRNEKLLKFRKKEASGTKPVPQPAKPSLILKGNDPKKLSKISNNDIYNMDDDSQGSVPDYSAFDSLVPPIEIDSLIKSKYSKKTFDSELTSFNSPKHQDDEREGTFDIAKPQDNLNHDGTPKTNENGKLKTSDSKAKVLKSNKYSDKKKDSSKIISSDTDKKQSKSLNLKEKKAENNKKVSSKEKDLTKKLKNSANKINDSSIKTNEPKNKGHKVKEVPKKNSETKDSVKKEKHKVIESYNKKGEKIKLKTTIDIVDEKLSSKHKSKEKKRETELTNKDIYDCSISSSSEADLQDGKVSSSCAEKKKESSSSNSSKLSSKYKSKHTEDSKHSKKPFKRKETSDSESEKVHIKSKHVSKKIKSSTSHKNDDFEEVHSENHHLSKNKSQVKNSQYFSSSDDDSEITIIKTSTSEKVKPKNSLSSTSNRSISNISSVDEDITISSDSDDDHNDECWKIYQESFNDNSNEATTCLAKENPVKETPECRDARNLQKKRIAHADAAVIKKPKFSSNKIRPVINPGQAMHNRYAQIMKMREENSELKTQSHPLSSGKPGVRIAVAANSSLLAAINEKKKLSQGVSDFAPLPSTVSKTLKPTKRIAHIPDVIAKPRPVIPTDYGSKVPTNIRQKFLNTFIDEYIKFTPNEEEAFQEALEEEKKAYHRSSSKAIYMNVASNTLAGLRRKTAEFSEGKKNESVSSTTNKSGKKSMSHQSVLNGPKAQKASFSIEKKKPPPIPDLKGTALYEYLLTFAMSAEQLKENGFPLAHPTEPGKAVIEGIYASKSRYCNDQFKRTCIRCQKVYYVNVDGDYVRDEECDFHWGRLWKRRIAGAFESRYNCCQGDAESDGCCVSPGHVFEGSESHVFKGYVTTLPKTPPPDKYYGIYALDCEMCYTTAGMELTRVTVVGPDCKPVYETFVKPLNQVLDYNTRFSGITEDNLRNVRTTLRDVQAVLLCIFNSKTILIGHSLESDFKALKLIHPTVVDTSVVFPHKMGLPYKRALKTLMGENLNKIIQNDVGGHDSQEDAVACMELMLWKVKEELKGNR